MTVVPTDSKTTNPTALAGKTVLVTGALGGIGAHMVDALAESGARVAVHHLGQPDKADSAVARLEKSGHHALAVESDVTDWDQVESMVRTVTKELGPVDVLVNNAGYMTPGRLVDMTLEQWTRTINVDLTGVFVVSRHVLPGMLERGHGVIINMSSQLAFKGAHDYASYCAAKAGVVGLTRAMAREVGPRVRVNAIAPGPIDTPFIEPWKTPAWVDERTRDSVIGRLGTPEEIAPAVVFLAGDGASLLHGQVLHLNGGGVMP
jgi:3-oxoacyl-[acyl-carrier protein] reductase